MQQLPYTLKIIYTKKILWDNQNQLQCMDNVW